MNRRNEYRAWMAAIAVVCTSGVVSALVPIVEHVIGGALIGGGLLWLAVLAVGRERRIRARLADPRTRPAPSRAATAARGPSTRVGPGDPTPVPPALTARRAAPTGGAR